MKELDNLEYELKQMLDNIQRVRDYADSLKYKTYQSLVVGELKHRCVALRSTLTRVGKIRTEDLWVK